MDTLSNILSLALNKDQPENMPVLTAKTQALNEGLQLQWRKLEIPAEAEMNDTALLIYYPRRHKKTGSSIDLKYCLAGNRYCPVKDCQGTFCAAHAAKDCLNSRPVAEVITISIMPSFLKQFTQTAIILPVKSTTDPLVRIMPVQGKMRVLLQQLLHHPYEGAWRNMHLQSKSLELLLTTVDSFAEPESAMVTCRFLANPEDRDKIMQARDIMLQHLESPLTIKELSRKVAMNECYLKKGFKEIFGTTIYDYFQKERMERAKFLLYDKGLSVTEVAFSMGYSCVSHFSTAFKKHTGLKPCELLR